jgi:uncharacterized tellurite resistance protein B-like protein
MSMWDFLGLRRDASEAARGPETETVRKIVDQLDRMEPERARFLAAFAYVLSRVAHADLAISREETLAMERIVRAVGGLPEEQAILVVQMAKTQSLLFGGTENFLVTREFQRLATKPERLRLLDCLFAVSAADETVSGVEEAEIRHIADELKIEHGDYIQARLAYKKHLSVLKKHGR